VSAPAHWQKKPSYRATVRPNDRYLVQHDVTATICIDLNGSLDAILKGMSQTFRRKIRTAERMNKLRIVRNGPEGSQNLLSLFNNFAQAKRSEVAPITSAVLRRYAPFSDISFPTWMASCFAVT
jgi:hypothetical protein